MLDWITQNASEEDIQAAHQIEQKATQFHEALIPEIAKSKEPVKDAGEAAIDVFNMFLKNENAQGRRIPTALSRVTTIFILQDLLRSIEELGIIQPEDDEERAGMFIRAMSELGKHHVYIQDQEKKGRAQREQQQAQQPQQPPQQAAPQPQQQPRGLLG